VYRDCTNSVLIVKKLKSSHKTVKTAKNNHWCTNRHMSTNTVPTVYQWSKTVKRQLKQQKGPLVYQSSHVYQDCTNSVPLVKNSQKAVKTAKMTIGVQIVTCLHRVRLIHKVLSPRPRPRPPNTQSPYWKSHRGFSKNPLLDPYNRRWLRSAILKIDMTSFFSAEGGPIWIKFRRLV